MLSELLPLKPGIIAALAGAGGKTTTLYRLAAELAAQGQHVITTTTTHIFPPTSDQTGALIIESDHALLMAKAHDTLQLHQHITLATTPTPEGKLRGLLPAWVSDLRDFSQIGAILVEADGAKGKMIKAPADHEPAIPQNADLVLLLASAEALGQPLSDATTHRPERVAAITGLHPGEIITPQALAQIATHEQGLLKNVPTSAAAILLLTHADERLRSSAEEAAQLALVSKRLSGVILCTLEWAQAMS
jgi:probable selenium-dependent hydroxylase accessory protein YqeC